MTLETRSWCNGTTNSHYLKLDEACLHLHSLWWTVGDVSVWTQSLECDKCELQNVKNVSMWTEDALVLDTSYPMKIALQNQFQNPSNTVCSYVYHFIEYGHYSLNFTNKHCTDIHVMNKPADPFLPILWAFIALLLGTAVYNVVKAMYKKNIFRYIHLTCSLNTELGRDLRIPDDGASLIRVEAEETADSRKPRLRSLDTFRGLCIIVMIFVNYGGGKYWFFRHSRWNGLTVADLVFPWFMWIMGVSITLSLRSQLQRSVPRPKLLVRVMKRSVILVALGIILNTHKDNHRAAGNSLPTLRIPGVLQRFGLAYLVVATLEAFFLELEDITIYVRWAPVKDILTSWIQWIFMFLLLCTHTLITFMLPVPGCPEGYLGPGGLHDGGKYFNCTGGAARYIDIAVFGRAHIYQTPTCKVIYHNTEPYDPEGLLGLLTSIFVVFLGVHAGKILINHAASTTRVTHWLIWGVIMGLIAGSLCGFSKNDGVIPVNKNLWSLSFVLALGSLAFFLLAALYFIVDVKKWWLGGPLYYAGMNSILLYVGHEMTGSMFPWSWSPTPQTHLAHLFMNLWGMSLWVLVSYILHRKKMFISI